MERFSLELEATKVFYGKNQSCRACRDQHESGRGLLEITRITTAFPCITTPYLTHHRRAYVLSASEWVLPTSAGAAAEPAMQQQSPPPERSPCILSCRSL